jgi:hypothetical protein
MDFSEFRRLLGADPRNQDPAFREARASSPEFRDAAAEADRFEEQLELALALQAPQALLDQLRSIPDTAAVRDRQLAGHGTWWRFALAASLLVAIGAAGVTWRMNSGWSSVQDYVVDHYQHDGLAVLAMADDPLAADVSGMLAEFDAAATPALAGIVSVIKNCPTPDGKGVHMILNTERGLVTVIYMPETPVSDGEQILFDDSEAVLVQLRHGSAVIIGSRLQNVSEFRSLVQESIVTADGNT